MVDGVDAVEQGIEVCVGEVELEHVETGGVFALAGGVVVVGERVDADDVVACRDQRLCEMRPDEAGRAGDDDLHV